MNVDDALPTNSNNERLFDDIALLDDGWRGENCLAPTETCREHMRAIFRQLQAFDMPTAKLYLSDAGWLEAEWTTQTGFEFMLRVTDLGHTFIEIVDAGGWYWHQDISNHDNPAPRIVECFRAITEGRFPKYVSAP